MKRFPVLPGSAADKAESKFQNGDTIVKIDQKIINDYGQINKELAQKSDKTITVVVDREETDDKGKPLGYMRRVAIPVKPNPLRHLGLAMKMGKITAIQNGSPAAAAGIKPGDMLLSPMTDDPMKLPQFFDRQAGKTVDLKIQSPNEKEPKVVHVKLRQPIECPPIEFLDNQVGISSLGIAFEVANEVEKVTEGSSAAQAGIQPGDVILQANIGPSDKEEMKKLDYPQSEGVIKFSDEEPGGRNWPALIAYLQQTLPGTTVDLTYLRHGKEITVKKLELIETADWLNPDRGFHFDVMEFERKATSVGDALALGGQETFDQLTIVFRSLKGLSTNRVSMRLIGGPVTIFWVALQKADQGNAVFLLFLTMLSANLAVINFLPIPVLDGGHFVLLAYEGIRGKPANETVQTVLAYIGLVLILALMVWAFGLDLHLFSRR